MGLVLQVAQGLSGRSISTDSEQVRSLGLQEFGHLVQTSSNLLVVQRKVVLRVLVVAWMQEATPTARCCVSKTSKVHARPGFFPQCRPEKHFTEATSLASERNRSRLCDTAQ